MSARLRVGDRVRILRGEHKGREGVIDVIGSRVVGVRIGDPSWPFPSLCGLGRHDLEVVADDVTEVGEALL